MPYSANSCLPWYSRRSTTWLAPLGSSRGLLRLAGVERLLEPPDDLRERGAGGEHRGHARVAQPRDLVGGDDPTPEHQHVADALLAQERHDAGEQGVVSAREHRETDGVGVLLQGGLRHLLGRLVQARVDDLEPGIAQRPGDHLRAPVVPVEAGFGDDDAVAPLHGLNPHMAPSRYMDRSPSQAPAPAPAVGNVSLWRRRGLPDWTRIRRQRSLGVVPAERSDTRLLIGAGAAAALAGVFV